jgi:phosphate transport system permease protein
MLIARNRLAKFWDRAARHAITAGGLLIIVSVIGMLVMIARVALPLFSTPAPAPLGRMHASPLADHALAVGIEEYGRIAFLILPQGSLVPVELQTGKALTPVPLPPPASGATIQQAAVLGGQQVSLLWSDGSQTMEQVKFADNRSTTCLVTRLGQFAPEPGGLAPRLTTMRGGEGSFTRVSYLADGRLHLTRQTVTEDFTGSKTTEATEAWIPVKTPARLTALSLDHAGSMLYAGSERGDLLRWDLRAENGPLLLDEQRIAEEPYAVTALALVLGDISLAVGDARGGIATWFAVPNSQTAGKTTLRKIHTLQSHPDAVTQLIPSRKTKSLLSIDARGNLQFDHMTTQRNLFTLAAQQVPLRLGALALRDNAMVAIGGDGSLRAWSLNIPHPEVAWNTLFGKVWYEGYREPVYAWQSSSASDDFEPKLSLVPLAYGTLKGTFYALLFAVPLAIFGALYTSQFMRPGLRSFVKPAIEIMAAIPSVVIGFLAALWLAPKVEGDLVAYSLALLFVPISVVLSLLLWQRFENRPRFLRLSRGSEFLLLVPIVCLGALLAAWLGPVLEAHFFGKSFPQWFFNTTAHRYDQRNSIIIALALGFAVIPIIFTIADDSMSNVPRSLTAASLALGASRWQTAWRIVLPSASPGIFAGVMIGFGRAVGETMIVLMATGNTPIMDWSPFNGMRTLSANIAVEIPEAPFGGTLYRVLFLTAVLLFIMTFIVNTAAELVRQRLRRKYGQL